MTINECAILGLLADGDPFLGFDPDLIRSRLSDRTRAVADVFLGLPAVDEEVAETAAEFQRRAEIRRRGRR